MTAAEDNTTSAEALPDQAQQEAPQRTAVLDSAHLGDIEGAFGPHQPAARPIIRAR